MTSTKANSKSKFGKCMKSELTATVLIATTAGVLVLTHDDFALSATIFAVGFAFCLYEVLRRKNLEATVQTHWLLLAIISGVAAYEFYSTAMLFLTAVFAMRFAVSLIRRGETEEISSVVGKLQAAHVRELDRIRQALTADFQAEVSRLTADNVLTVNEYQRQLANLRANLDESHRKKISELEARHQAACLKLKKTFSANEDAFIDELDKLEAAKKLAEAELAALKDTTLTNLRERLADQDEYIRQLETERSQNRIYTNGKLHELLRNTLNDAKVEVDIMSPWVNFRIVNYDLQDKIERLLKRGVVIKLAYGIGNDEYGNAKARNEQVQQTVEILQRKFSRYENFRVKKISSHGKIFICDDKFYVLTSMNPLSNDGTSWEEIGELSTNRENLIEYRKKYFMF